MLCPLDKEPCVGITCAKAELEYYASLRECMICKGTDIGFTKNDGRRCNKCGSQLTSKVSKGIKCEL